MSIDLEADALTIEQLLAENAALRAERDRISTHAERLEARNTRLEARNERLAFQVKRMAYIIYGRKSEKLSREQLGQLALAFGATEEEAAALHPVVPHRAALEEPIEVDLDPRRKATRRNHKGRTRLSPEIERVVTQVLVPAEERACKGCGHEMTPFRFVEHERVEHVPEKLVVHVEQREVIGCKRCRGDASTAPREAPALMRRAGSSLLATLIENKCDDALPVYRQRDRFSRLGFAIPTNTLYDYFAYGTDLIIPVAKTTLSRVLGDSYVQADDTKFQVLDKRRPKKSYKGCLWAFASSGPLIAYVFTDTWKASDIAPFLWAIDGDIQCDDYKGYSSEVRGPDGLKRALVPPERRLGCMMHVRRRFHEAYRLGEKRAAPAIEAIAKIYEIEALAKERGMKPEERHALRQQESMPWLDAFDAWVDAHAAAFAPKSKLGRAVSYALQQRPFVRRCFSDGRFEIDTGKVERSIREPAIGRAWPRRTRSCSRAVRSASRRGRT